MAQVHFFKFLVKDTKKKKKLFIVIHENGFLPMMCSNFPQNLEKNLVFKRNCDTTAACTVTVLLRQTAQGKMDDFNTADARDEVTSTRPRRVHEVLHRLMIIWALFRNRPQRYRTCALRRC